MNLVDDMLMTYDSHDGGTYNQQSCPKCNDGVRNEPAMSVTKTHSHLKWICFHASCGFKGIVDHRSGKVLKNNPVTSKIPKPYRKSTVIFKGEYLKEKFGVTTPTLWNEETKRVLFPVKAFTGEVVGYVARGYPELGWKLDGPKTITYTNTLDIPFIHFPPGLADKMVLVEDWVSAERLAGADIPSVALLGTHISHRDALYLREAGIEHLVVAFDADAWNKYHNIRQQYGLLFKTLTFKMWPSKVDPKDMSDNELLEIFT